tara:strand:+ start:28020 stop:29042 length:1023 start_codon:yes stop_codon:yes gene_type:complete
MVPPVWGKSSLLLDKAPAAYQVREGDTLWGIAGRFLHEPWLWPEIWAGNPNIDNPHLIFPGDRIILGYDAAGNPSLRLERKGVRTYWENGQRVVKLSPEVRFEAADGAIPTVPISVIKPFFNQSRVISDEIAENSPKIVALDEDHLVVGAGDRIYARPILPEIPLDVFSIFRVEKDYIHPTTNEYLGTEGLELGKAVLEQHGDPASLILRKSNAEIRVGDQLIEPENHKLDAYFIPKAPQGMPEGLIISVFGGLSQIGQYQVIVITGGRDQFRESGDVLSVRQSQKDIPSRLRTQDPETMDYPRLKVGKLVVFRVFDKVSYALVMSATRPIYLLDSVGMP